MPSQPTYLAAAFLASMLAPAVHAATAIIGVQGAAPGVLMVELQTDKRNEAGGTASSADPLDLALAKWRINGAQVGAISRMSMPYDEERSLTASSPNLFPVTVRHRIYLRMSQALADGRPYAITTPYGNTALTFSSRSTLCESVKVNQVGYSKLATSRYANFGAFLGDAGAVKLSTAPAFEVIDARSGRVVTAGQGRYIKDDTGTGAAASGEHVYRLPLERVPEGGPYFVAVAGCGRSHPFLVGDAASREIAYVSTRGLYHQRCGMALDMPYTEHTRAVCHQRVADTRTPWVDKPVLTVPPNAAMHPIRGGHHDAGDFDRRPMHTIIPILMLSYYDAFPTHFIDRQYQIPESGNGIPDFVDEAMWAVLGWENLQVFDKQDPQYGGVRAGTETDRHPVYGVHSAANDPGRYGTWAVSEDVTALSAGIFAQASRVIRPYDRARADALLGRARAAWAYLARTADVRAVKTRFMYASLQLYLATGEETYHALFKRTAQAIVVAGGSWPEQYLPGNLAASAQTVHFVSYLTQQARPVDAALAQALKQRIFSFADNGTYMGPAPENEAYAQGATKFVAWGAATTQGKYADVYAFAARFTSDSAKKQAYTNAVSQYADFSLGLNPLNRSFVTGLGTVVPRSPAHLDSYFTKFGLTDGVTQEHVGKPKGNVPGIVIYGPSQGRSGAAYQTAVSNKLFPAWEKLPGLRRWGDGWSLINSNEFSTWETMVWNVAMHGFLYDASQDPAAGTVPGTCTGSTCGTALACTIAPGSGAITLRGLPANVVCVQRKDNRAQQKVVNGAASFPAPPAAPGTSVYLFSGVNGYGACINKVALMACSGAAP
ncbi:glycoside hydrolase family 9 protein [Massilia sp. CF038]|uniref:glycoside hydrolase family 9 protein n=1 Tax=Massilia sp. CF038 TaxID=1881045 RepID=UPI000921E989|nr:glycoside hydrolase family 9 protein [Massilia sp. CF038]SHH30268.1 endoglucanase [Massilia sp. CF038]